MDLASLFAVPAAAVRIIFLSDDPLGPAGRIAESLDQGLGTVDFLQPGLDISQPRQIGLAALVTKGLLGILQFPK